MFYRIFRHFLQLLYTFTHFRHKNVPSGSIRTLLCCIVKRENLYLGEYVKWYKEKGFTNILIYDNNDVDGERLEDVISDHIKDGFVKVVDFRGRKVCQLAAYEDCCMNYAASYDWIAFFDADEFLDFNGLETIGQYLSLPPFRKYEMIHVNWLCYGSEGNLRYEPKPLSQRFTNPLVGEDGLPESYSRNKHIKSFVRGHIPGFLLCWQRTPHTPAPCYFRCCDDIGQPCQSDSPFNRPNYDRAFLRHYTTKSLEEFVTKVKRGFPDFQVYGKPFGEKMSLMWYECNPDSGIERKELLEMFSGDNVNE